MNRDRDSHIHIIDPENFPLDPDRDYTPKAASIANATDFETSLGIDHACIVLPSIYGTNNSILVDALRQFNGSYRGVAVIDPDNITNTTLDTFQEAGVRGLRVNLDSQNKTDVSEVVRKNTDVAKQMNWVLQLYTPLSSLTYLHDYIVDSGVTFAFDHFGHTLVGSKTNVSMNTYDPYRTLGFRELIDLVQRKIMFVKISGPYRDSNQAPLYEDMRVVAETIINAGPDMVVYGSDWPHTPQTVGDRLQVQDFQDINDAALVEITKDWAGSDAQIQRLFVDNPRRLWQWYEDS
ncbi:amidohydrolase family protein [Diaporthe sp. PMI_573]|nr:amidohydrolase family protein [Diaporthaceae sp. PMI_573]